jgi:hypothetical protein
MKSIIYAQVRMTIIRQVEFEADTRLSVKEIEKIAEAQAKKEYGDCDEIEVEDFDLSHLRKEEGE